MITKVMRLSGVYRGYFACFMKFITNFYGIERFQPIDVLNNGQFCLLIMILHISLNIGKTTIDCLSFLLRKISFLIEFFWYSIFVQYYVLIDEQR